MCAAIMLKGAKTLSAFVCRGPRRARESALTSTRIATTATNVAMFVLSDNYVSTECVNDVFRQDLYFMNDCLLFHVFCLILVVANDNDIKFMNQVPS